MATAILQLVIVVISSSAALLADTIHNFGDAATAIQLGVAFMFARLKPSKRVTYGYGRIEDIAGVIVVLLILFSAIVRDMRRFSVFSIHKPFVIYGLLPWPPSWAFLEMKEWRFSE